MKPAALVPAVIIFSLTFSVLCGHAALAQETAPDDAGVEEKLPEDDSGRERPEENGEETHGEGDEAREEKRKIQVDVNPLRAKISPTVEISFPSGNLSEHFEHGFNRLAMSFNLDYNFFDESLIAAVSFSHRFGRLTPSVGFSENLDFENLVAPKIVGSKVILAPTDKYISRLKTVDFKLSYNFAKNLSFIETFIASDVFRGSLSSGTILDEGTDLTERIGLVYDTIEVRESGRRVRFQGNHARSLLDFRYRDMFSNPISVETQNTFLSNVIFGHGWNLDFHFSANSPVRVYDKEKVDFYSLGGFDTIRGYPHGSLHAFRFAHIGTTWEWEILREKELKFRLFKRPAAAHQFGLLFLLDGLALQDQLDIDSPVLVHASLGTGFSFLITGKEGGHLQVDLSISQPLESGYAPIFYFKSSIISIEKNI